MCHTETLILIIHAFGSHFLLLIYAYDDNDNDDYDVDDGTDVDIRCYFLYDVFYG